MTEIQILKAEKKQLIERLEKVEIEKRNIVNLNIILTQENSNLIALNDTLKRVIYEREHK